MNGTEHSSSATPQAEVASACCSILDAETSTSAAVQDFEEAHVLQQSRMSYCFISSVSVGDVGPSSCHLEPEGIDSDDESADSDDETFINYCESDAEVVDVLALSIPHTDGPNDLNAQPSGPPLDLARLSPSAPSPRTTSAVEVEPGDTTVEVEPADPLEDIPAIELLTYLREAVKRCPRNSPSQAIGVFVLGAIAVCQAINDAWVGGSNPFEEGGVYDTAIVYAMFELGTIRRRYRSYFDYTCLGLEAMLVEFALESQQTPRWSTRTVVDPCEVPPEVVVAGQEQASSPNTATATATGTPVSPAATSATNGTAGEAGEMAGVCSGTGVIAAGVEDNAFLEDPPVVNATEGVSNYCESDSEAVDDSGDSFFEHDEDTASDCNESDAEVVDNEDIGNAANSVFFTRTADPNGGLGSDDADAGNVGDSAASSPGDGEDKDTTSDHGVESGVEAMCGDLATTIPDNDEPDDCNAQQTGPSVYFADLSHSATTTRTTTSTVQGEPADPPKGLAASEALTLLPTSVALCPWNSPSEGIRVLVRGATAVCEMANDAWVGEQGGLSCAREPAEDHKMCLDDQEEEEEGYEDTFDRVKSFSTTWHRRCYPVAVRFPPENVPTSAVVPPRDRSRRSFVLDPYVESKVQAVHRGCCSVVLRQGDVPVAVLVVPLVPPTTRSGGGVAPGGAVEGKARAARSECLPLIVFRRMQLPALLVVPSPRRSERRFLQCGVLERNALAESSKNCPSVECPRVNASALSVGPPKRRFAQGNVVRRTRGLHRNRRPTMLRRVM